MEYPHAELRILSACPFRRNDIAERVCDPGNIRRRALPAEAGGPGEPRAREGADRGLGRREQLPEVGTAFVQARQEQ